MHQNYCTDHFHRFKSNYLNLKWMGDENMVFFVKARIDVSQMRELGVKLQNGGLDRSHIKIIFCMKDDPSVGFSFWEAENEKVFNENFNPHREYYHEVEVIPMITSPEAQQILLKQLTELS